MSNAHLRFANQLEIIRSEEKDRYIISQLSQQFDELYRKIFGLNHFHIYQPFLHRLSQLIYYFTTTLANRQTIGEEYVCLIQYDAKQRQIPSLIRRFLMILMRIFGDIVSKYLFTSFVLRPLNDEYFHPNLSKQTLELLTRFFFNFIERTHRILFYLTGSHYDLSKTLTQIRYLIYTRSTIENQSIEEKLKKTLKFLSVCLVVQHLIESYNDLKQINLSISQHRHELERQNENENENDKERNESNAVRCPLCYELAIGTASLVAECGHVFCWDCIHTWIIDNPTCPLCKTTTSQSRIVHLINY